MRDDDLHDLPIVRELGQQLRLAQRAPDPDRRRRRSRRARLAAAGIAMVCAAAVAAVMLPGGDALDPVAEAEAALRAEDSVLHVVLRGGMVQPDGEPVRMLFRTGGNDLVVDRRSERWIADDGRTRNVQDLRDRDGQVAGTLTSGIAADGSSWQRTPDGQVSSTTLTPDVMREQAARLRDPGVPPAADPIGGPRDPTEVLRRLFADGKFQASPEVDRDGRRVRDLVATESGRNYPPAGMTFDTRIVYTVDANSFEPLKLRGYHRLPNRSDFQLLEHTVVERFERLDHAALPEDFFAVPQR